MTDDYSPQYQTQCVLLEDGDTDAETILAFAKRIGAFYEDEPGSRCVVVQFPGRPQELYTEEALRRTCNQPLS